MAHNLAQDVRHPEHEHADAGDPECHCYIAGWKWGYQAGEAAALDEDEMDDESSERLN